MSGLVRERGDGGPARPRVGERQVGPAHAGRGAGGPRRRDRLHRLHGGGHPLGRDRRHERLGRHGVPGDARRPGEDAAPRGARRHPGRPPESGTRRGAGSAGLRAVRPGRREPVSVPGDGRRRCGRSTTSSSRSTSAGRRSSGRRRRTSGRSPWWSPRSGTTTCWRSSATRARSPGRLVWRSPRRRSTTSPATTSPSRSGSACRRAARTSCRSAAFLALEKAGDLRYGENPHQRAALYRTAGGSGPLGGAEVLQGKEMSFNNWLDAESALSVARSLPAPAAVVVKHNNPCGAAVADSLEEAYRAAVACDPVSAFGGVVACNVPVDPATAAAIAEIFTEAVVAPGFDEQAIATFSGKQNLRVVRVGEPLAEPFEVRVIEGGALVQEPDAVVERREEMTVASFRQPDRGGVAGPVVRVDGRRPREVERHRVRVGGRHGRRRRRADVPRRLGRHRGREGRRPREGLGHGERRVLPVPRRRSTGRPRPA